MMNTPVLVAKRVKKERQKMSPKNTLNFTMKNLSSIKPDPSKRIFYYDPNLENLAFAVNPKGTKTWFLYQWIDSRPERIRIGRFPLVSLSEAKRCWKTLQGRIAHGENPAQDKREQRSEPTLREFFEGSFLERYAKIQKKSWKQDVRLFKNYLSPLANRKLSQINDAQVSRLHRQVGSNNGQYVANRAVMLLSAVFNKAKKWKVYTGDNPASAVDLFREESRENYLSKDEIRSMMASVLEENDEKFSAFVQMCLLTGVRSGNIVDMKWEQISDDSQQWEIPRENTKNKKSHVVQLTEQASGVLNSLSVDSTSEFVFHDGESKKIGRRFRYLFSKATKRAGIECRVHDLRHTVASQMVSSGVSLPIIQEALGHLNYRSTLRYAHVAPSPVRESLRLVTEEFFVQKAG
jgi:integrase